MNFKVSSGKAQGVKKLRALFPEGWSESPSTSEPDAVLIDALQGLIGFSEGTGKACAMRASRLAREYIESGCPLVIFCFDRHADVPLAKAAEQAMRAESVRKGREAKDALASPPGLGFRELSEPGIWLDRPVPYDFNEGLQDREGYRRNVIRFLCRQWLCADDPTVRLHPGGDAKVIITGHCLAQEDLVELTDDEGDWRALGLRAGDDPEHIPIVIESATYRFDPDLRHRLGEGEMQFFHFLEQLRPERPLLISTDSDVLFLVLTHLRKHPTRKCDVDWRYDSRQPTKLFCHVNKFVDAVQKGRINLAALERKQRKGADFTHVARRWTQQADPVMQIVAAQALAGTDYTQGMLKVTHEAVFEALVLVSDKIGPLVTDLSEPKSVPQAYVRLLIASWIQSRMPELEVAPSFSTLGDDPDPDKVQEAWRKHALKAWTGSQRFDASYRLPHPVNDSGHFINRILRWSYYIDMQCQVGHAALVLDHPGRWGYGPVEGEITRANIFPLLNEKGRVE